MLSFVSGFVKVLPETLLENSVQRRVNKLISIFERECSDWQTPSWLSKRTAEIIKAEGKFLQGVKRQRQWVTFQDVKAMSEASLRAALTAEGGAILKWNSGNAECDKFSDLNFVC